MPKKIIAASILLLLLFFDTCFAAKDQKLLENITFAVLSANEESITFKLNSANIPKTFAIKGDNPRIVFDFADTKFSRILKNTINTNGKLIKRIRIGFHREPTQKTRVVLDLTNDRVTDFTHDFDAADNSLVITVFHAGSEQPAPAATKGEAKIKEVLPTTKKQAVVQANQVKTKGKKVQPAAGKVPTSDQEKAAPVAAETPSVQPAKEESIAQKEVQPAVQEGTDKVATKGEQKPAAEKIPQHEQAKTSSPPEPAAKEPVEEKAPPAAAVTAKVDEAPKKVATPPAVKPQKKPEPHSGKLATLNSVTFDGNSNRGEMVLFNLKNFQPPDVFGVEKGNPQVICEFKNTRAGATVEANTTTEGQYVRKIHINRDKEKNKVRVVIDLAPGSSYDLQQVFFKADDLFVLIVNPLTGKK